MSPTFNDAENLGDAETFGGAKTHDAGTVDDADVVPYSLMLFLLDDVVLTLYRPGAASLRGRCRRPYGSMFSISVSVLNVCFLSRLFLSLRHSMFLFIARQGKPIFHLMII